MDNDTTKSNIATSKHIDYRKNQSNSLSGMLIHV